MFGLANLISPKNGLVMIRKKIESELKKPVPTFELMFIRKAEKLQFIIEKEFFTYDSDILKSAILAIGKKSLKKGQEIDIVKISINENDEVKAALYFTENQEKKFITLNL